jgi:hypothetical protein
LLGSQFFITKVGQPFSDPFGGIAPWYVTLPLVQLVFELMLYIWRKLQLFVSLLLLEKSMILLVLSLIVA